MAWSDVDQCGLSFKSRQVEIRRLPRIKRKKTVHTQWCSTNDRDLFAHHVDRWQHNKVVQAELCWFHIPDSGLGIQVADWYDNERRRPRFNKKEWLWRPIMNDFVLIVQPTTMGLAAIADFTASAKNAQTTAYKPHTRPHITRLYLDRKSIWEKIAFDWIGQIFISAFAGLLPGLHSLWKFEFFSIPSLAPEYIISFDKASVLFAKTW